jgi:hypothetical protein
VNLLFSDSAGQLQPKFRRFATVAAFITVVNKYTETVERKNVPRTKKIKAKS